MRSLMFQASIPAACWVETLRTATYLLNLCPTKNLSFATHILPSSEFIWIYPIYGFLGANATLT
jgi:hypothetical protein